MSKPVVETVGEGVAEYIAERAPRSGGRCVRVGRTRAVGGVVERAERPDLRASSRALARERRRERR